MVQVNGNRPATLRYQLLVLRSLALIVQVLIIGEANKDAASKLLEDIGTHSEFLDRRR